MNTKTTLTKTLLVTIEADGAGCAPEAFAAAVGDFQRSLLVTGVVILRPRVGEVDLAVKKAEADGATKGAGR